MIGRMAVLAAASAMLLGGCQLLTGAVTVTRPVEITTCTTYQLTYPGGAPMRDGDAAGAADVMNARLQGLGVTGGSAIAGPEGTVVVGLPDGDLVRWTRILEQVGALTFVPVPPEFSQQVVDGQPLPAGMDATPIFEGSGVTSASVSDDELGRPAISLTLAPDAAERFDAHAAAHFGERFAMVLDGVVMSAPSINAVRFDGQAQISGDFTQQEAEDLAVALDGGVLPAAVEAISGSEPVEGACPVGGSAG